MTDVTTTEMRCPQHQHRMFGVVYGEAIVMTNGASPLIQFTCRDCRKMYQGLPGGEDIFRVYHYYNSVGWFQRTEVLRKERAVSPVCDVTAAEYGQGRG